MIDFFADEHKAYFVMERAGDITLENFVQQFAGQITIDQIKQVSRQLLTAIHFLHSHGIVHRDIKPDNIVLTIDNVDSSQLNLKLIDFNVAHNLHDCTR